jgi:hypothetical protein
MAAERSGKAYGGGGAPSRDAAFMSGEGMVLSTEDMVAALAALGADPASALTPAERDQLASQGFLNLGQLLTRTQCEEAKRRIHAQIALEKAEGGDVNGFGVGGDPTGAERLGNLLNKINDDGLFDVCVTNPRLLAAMRLHLGDSFKLSSLNFRMALPGGGKQGLHTDWGDNPSALDSPPQWQVCNSIWMLDDFTETNGATRLVPRSHLTGKTTSVLADGMAPQPGEKLVTGPAGTVVVFSSHCFHAGTHNATDTPRMGMHGYFTRRHHSQQVRTNPSNHWG